MNFAPLVAACAALSISGAAASQTPSNPPTQPAPAEADWRTPDPQNVLVIDTNKGRVIVELAPAVAPLSAGRVRDLARAGFYDGLAFFRVIDDFMDQTGDPLNTGSGGSTKPNVAAEFTFRRGSATPMAVADRAGGLEIGFIGSLPVISQTIQLAAMTADQKVAAWGTFCPGVAGMARAQDPDSANSQFFLMRGAQLNLDHNYTPFGRVIVGLDIVRSIKTGEPVAAPQDKMVTVRVLADIPAAQRPTVRVIDTAGPWFKAMTDKVRNQKVVGLSACDLDLPSQVK